MLADDEMMTRARERGEKKVFFKKKYRIRIMAWKRGKRKKYKRKILLISSPYMIN